jgi:hypothetical protein
VHLDAEERWYINQPVLVANGNNTRMIPTKNSYLLAEHLPDA